MKGLIQITQLVTKAELRIQVEQLCITLSFCDTGDCPLRSTSTPWVTAWNTVPLTLAFSFMLDGKTAPTTEELVDASLGAARHKHPLDEPGELFLT